MARYFINHNTLLSLSLYETQLEAMGAARRSSGMPKDSTKSNARGAKSAQSRRFASRT